MPPTPTDAGVVLVPHTHWDREWYEPHEVFRLRLVHVLDGVLDQLEADPGFRFTLDGQAAALADYLEIRPEHTDRVRALVEQGRLAVGPFHILLDEFCCDGETIVRNLELGIGVAERAGGAMPVGYLPDMFGHTAQMPQLLRGFGLHHAALWRGVPARVTEHGFRWVAPDGSAVRCEYLFDGYGSALDMLAQPGRLGELSRDYRGRTRSWYREDPVLGMVGTDHSAPDPDLMDRVRAHNAEAADGDTPRLAVATLWEYLVALGPEAAQERLPVVTGELRSHARGNLLPGVFSIRTNLKAAMARAELTLTRAERLDALYGTPGEHDAFLDLAWARVVESTAHDSITGCGVDATADQVAARLDSAAHIGHAVIGHVAGRLAARVPSDAALVANTLPWDRTVQAEVVVAGGDLPPHAQLLDPEISGQETVLGDESMAAGDLVRILRRIHGRELFGQQILDYTWGEDTLEFTVAEQAEGPFDLAALTAEIEQRTAQEGTRWRVCTVAAPRHRALVQVPVPALGHVPVRPGQTGPPSVPATASGHDLGNGLVSVHVTPDGSLDLVGEDGTRLTGVGRLADCGDRGDAYNFGPLAGDTDVTVPTSVLTRVLQAGPLRAVVEVERAYDLPRGLSPESADHRQDKTEELRVRTLVELRAGEPFVRLSLTMTNTVRNHRLRLHVPAGGPVDRSYAGGQFAVTERGRQAEGGWGEFPIPTYPATGFISAGDAHVLLDKLTEFEVVTGADPAADDELALTLLRAVGMMSVNVHPLRDEPAGSAIPVPGAQYLGTEITTRLAVLPHGGGWEAAGVPRWAEVFRHEAVVVPGTAPSGGELPPEGRGPVLTGPAVLTSLRSVASSVGADRAGPAATAGQDLEARLVSVSGEATDVALQHPDGGPWQPTDLRGRPVGPALEGAATLAPWSIRTLRRPGRSAG